MIRLVSGLAVPQFGRRIFASARIRAASRFKRFLCCDPCHIFSCTPLRRIRVPQVEDQWSRWRRFWGMFIAMNVLKGEGYWKIALSPLSGSCSPLIPNDENTSGPNKHYISEDVATEIQNLWVCGHPLGYTIKRFQNKNHSFVYRGTCCTDTAEGDVEICLRWDVLYSPVSVVDVRLAIFRNFYSVLMQHS
jgi:hypothetical protein